MTKSWEESPYSSGKEWGSMFKSEAAPERAAGADRAAVIEECVKEIEILASDGEINWNAASAATAALRALASPASPAPGGEDAPTFAEQDAAIREARWSPPDPDAIAALRRQRDETRIRNDYLEMEASAREAEVEWLTHERDEARRSYCKAADERNAAERLAARYKAALEDIAHQPLISETAEDQMGSIEDGYDECIRVARRALSAPSLPEEPADKDDPQP